MRLPPQWVDRRDDCESAPPTTFSSSDTHPLTRNTLSVDSHRSMAEVLRQLSGGSKPGADLETEVMARAAGLCPTQRAEAGDFAVT